MSLSSIRSVALASALVLVACGGGDAPDLVPDQNGGTSTGGRPKGPITIGKDGVPVDKDGKNITPTLEGHYELSNVFDLTSTSIFPEPVTDSLVALANFREKPTATIVDLIKVADPPYVGTFLNVIPSFLRDLVFGYIDEHLIKALYNKVPVMQTVTGMLDDMATIVTKFEVVSQLDLPQGDEIGNSRATHKISGVGYNWSGQRHVLQSPELLQNLQKTELDANAVALAQLSNKLEGGRLKMGSHGFKVPIGSLALIGVDAMIKDKFGVKDLREGVGKIVNCKAVADVVSKRCIDPPGAGKICVDHAKEIEGFCNVGLDILVGVVRGQIKRLDLPLLNLKEGQAQMWDAAQEGGPLDAVVDRISGGYWTATVNVGKDEKTILGTFTGKRTGDIQYGN